MEITRFQAHKMLPGEDASSMEDNFSQYFNIQSFNKQFLQTAAPFSVYA
jgi:hypothetical protein